MVLICKPRVPFTEGFFMQSLVEIDPMVLLKRFFDLVTVLLFVIISPWENVWPSHLNKLEFPSPKDAPCNEFGWNWPSTSSEVFIVFLLFRNYLPLEKGMALHLNKLESPSLKNSLCQICLKLVQLVWGRRFMQNFKFRY